MTLVSATAGAQFTPAGVLKLPLAVETPGAVLEYLAGSLKELG